MRIFTCTPVAFGGGADFFARDSGLLCRGLQAIGVESQAVMPGKRKSEDGEDLIRTDYRNLESADWWRSQEIDGVVLYAWGRPKFRKVAAAIQEAGVFLILSQDSAGQISPLSGLPEWVRSQWIYGGQGRGLAAWLRFAKLASRGLSIGLLMTDPLRAQHLRYGNAIACVSPRAAERYRKLCHVYGGAELSERVRMIPHPVESTFQYADTRKLRQVVCVGRWQDIIQKRPWLMTKVIGSLVAKDSKVSVVIVGQSTEELTTWHQTLDHQQRDRIHLVGMLEREELKKVLCESQVFYSPSSYESFSIAAAEALCSGCSIVAGRSITMPSFEWFVSEESGQLAEKDDCSGHAETLRAELECWDSGERDPANIANFWCERLHTNNVAAQVVALWKSRLG